MLIEYKICKTMIRIPPKLYSDGERLEINARDAARKRMRISLSLCHTTESRINVSELQRNRNELFDLITY
jgi:hypothetical protein